jgi:hypothetical protein
MIVSPGAHLAQPVQHDRRPQPFASRYNRPSRQRRTSCAGFHSQNALTAFALRRA